MAQTAKPVQLEPQTLKAFDAYIHQAEAEMEQTLRGGEAFLWSQQSQERTQDVSRGQVVAEFWTGQGPAKVPVGLIHDWIAAAFIPASTIREVLAVIQEYDNHKNVYKPEVVDSKLVRRDGNDFQVYLRLLKKKIITVVLDSDHEVHYLRTSESCRRIPVTDFSGACILTGDSRSAMRESWSNAAPSP